MSQPKRTAPLRGAAQSGHNMSSLLYRPALLIAVTGSIFALAAFFTRATPRRMAGALAGGFGFGLLNLAGDVVAYHMRWW